MVIALNMSPERTSQILQVELMDYVPFRDASGGSCNYKMTISHCLYAIHKGISMRKIFRFPFKYSSTESGINVSSFLLSLIFKRPVEFYGENMEERLAKVRNQQSMVLQVDEYSKSIIRRCNLRILREGSKWRSFNCFSWEVHPLLE